MVAGVVILAMDSDALDERVAGCPDPRKKL
jgi:hypothetical protein